MTKFRIGFRLLAGLILTTGLVHSVAAATPTAEQILLYKPKQIGVEVTTPTAVETSACTVDLEKGRKFAGDKQATAWVLKDGQGKILRKFHDTTGEGRVNDGKRQGKWTWFYKNGTLKAVGEYANGQLWDEGNYEGGKKVDEWKVYHQNSELKQTKVFKRKE